MTSAPLILITPSTNRAGVEFCDYSLDLSDAYPRAIMAAGGIPWVMPYSASPKLLAECVRRCDGVMLTGGDDIEPKLYKSKLSARVKKTVSPADPVRDLAELLLIQEVFRQRKPLLAICRGQQILNVALGGSLVVDIPMENPGAIEHRRMDLKDKTVHEIDISPGSRLAEIFGKRTMRVNSSHHQAVARLAKPLRVTARSADGIIEALELGQPDRHLLPYLIAVQFHPERLIGRYKEFLKLFHDFREVCAEESRRSL
jgi:putative glutamine amidotransferase